MTPNTQVQIKNPTINLSKGCVNLCRKYFAVHKYIPYQQCCQLELCKLFTSESNESHDLYNCHNAGKTFATLGVVHKLRFEEEVGRQFKNVNFYKVEIVNYCQGGQKTKNVSTQFMNDPSNTAQVQIILLRFEIQFVL